MEEYSESGMAICLNKWRYELIRLIQTFFKLIAKTVLWIGRLQYFRQNCIELNPNFSEMFFFHIELLRNGAFDEKIGGLYFEIDFEIDAHNKFTINDWVLWIFGVFMKCGGYNWKTGGFLLNLVFEEDWPRWWRAISRKSFHLMKRN